LSDACPPSSSSPRHDANATATAEGDGWTDWNSWANWAKTTVLPMLPSLPLPEMLTLNRAFATFTTPSSRDFRTVVNLTTAYTEDGPEGRVLVASYDGFLYIYRLNTIEGGECELIKQVNLLGIDDPEHD